MLEKNQIGEVVYHRLLFDRQLVVFNELLSIPAELYDAQARHLAGEGDLALRRYYLFDATALEIHRNKRLLRGGELLL